MFESLDVKFDQHTIGDLSAINEELPGFWVSESDGAFSFHVVIGLFRDRT